MNMIKGLILSVTVAVVVNLVAGSIQTIIG